MEINLHHRVCGKIRAVNPPFLARRLPVFEAVSLSPNFKRNLPVLKYNNQLSNIKVIVYANDVRKNSLFSFTNFLPILGSAWDLLVTDFQMCTCKNMNPVIVYLTQTETLVMLSIVYIMINHSRKCNYTATLRYFIFKNFRGGGGGGEQWCPQEAKKLSPHCMPVKVLGHTDLPFSCLQGWQLWKMPKSGEVGFRFDKSKTTLYSTWHKKHRTKLQITEQKLVSRLNTHKKWSNKENNISSKLGQCDSNYQQMCAVMRNQTRH